MLPFGLKMAWFALSVLGTLSCWLIFMAYAKAINTFWAPMSYCIAVTLLEGSFWLGVIWRMDPDIMPRGFCVAQSAVMGFSFFLLTGTCAASTLATTVYVIRPKQWGISVGSLLPWRPRYLLPLVLFPCLASIAQISVLLTVKINWRNDDLSCDVDHPEWARFLSYAGLPFLLTIPSFCLSTRSAIHVTRTHKHLERSRCRDLGDFPPFPPQHHWLKNDTELQIPPGAHPDMPPGTSPVLGLSVSSPSVQTIRLPYCTDDPSGLEDRAVVSREPDTISLESAIPTFAPPSTIPYAADCGVDEGPKTVHDYDYQGGHKSVGPIDSTITLDSVQHVRRSPYERMTRPSSRRLPPNLPAPIWRLIVFQMVLCAVQLLSSLSTLIDVIARRKTPTPFGTQHVALLLAAWGPVLVFGPLAVVRQQVRFRCSDLTKFRP